MQYEAVTSIRCGKIYSPGQLIPDGVLSDRDIKTLLELGSIKAATPEGEDTSPGVPKITSDLSADISDAPITPPSGSEILTPQSVLDYVNSADVATLEKIKGVGKTTAKAMASHGTFATIEELKQLVPNVNWDSIQIEGSK